MAGIEENLNYSFLQGGKTLKSSSFPCENKKQGRNSCRVKSHTIHKNVRKPFNLHIRVKVDTITSGR